MNTKQIVAILAVLAVAAAGIGAAYAYNAQLISEVNTVDSHWITLDATGEINDRFSSDIIQYDTKTIDATNATYTPYGMETIYRALEGAPVNLKWANVGTPEVPVMQYVADPYIIAIDSSTLQENDWFTFSVQTYTLDKLDKKDLLGHFAMKFVYHVITPADEDTPIDWEDENSYEDTTYEDYAILTGTNAVPLFTSKVASKDYYTDAGNPAAEDDPETKPIQYVELMLYALEYDGAIENGKPDYKNVEYDFTATTIGVVENGKINLEDDGKVKVTITDADEAALNAAKPLLYSEGKGRIIADSDESGESNVTTFSGLFYATYTSNANYVSSGTYAFIMTSEAAVVDSDTLEETTVKECIQDLVISSRETGQEEWVPQIQVNTADTTALMTEINANIVFHIITHTDVNTDQTVAFKSGTFTSVGMTKITVSKTIDGVEKTVSLWVEVIPA